MLIVDREHFISYIKGILLFNDNGNVFAIDELKCKQAEEIINNGKEIGFTIKNILVSKIYKDKNDEFVEVLI